MIQVIQKPVELFGIWKLDLPVTDMPEVIKDIKAYRKLRQTIKVWRAERSAQVRRCRSRKGGTS